MKIIRCNYNRRFLEARKVDGASFDWSPPDETVTYKWVCPSFTKEIFTSIETE